MLPGPVRSASHARVQASAYGERSQLACHAAQTHTGVRAAAIDLAYSDGGDLISVQLCEDDPRGGCGRGRGSIKQKFHGSRAALTIYQCLPLGGKGRARPMAEKRRSSAVFPRHMHLPMTKDVVRDGIYHENCDNLDGGVSIYRDAFIHQVYHGIHWSFTITSTGHKVKAQRGATAVLKPHSPQAVRSQTGP